MRLIPDEEAQKEVLRTLAEALGNVTTFAQMALNAWLEPRIDKLIEVT